MADKVEASQTWRSPRGFYWNVRYAEIDDDELVVTLSRDGLWISEKYDNLIKEGWRKVKSG